MMHNEMEIAFIQLALIQSGAVCEESAPFQCFLSRDWSWLPVPLDFVKSLIRASRPHRVWQHVVAHQLGQSESAVVLTF